MGSLLLPHQNPPQGPDAQPDDFHLRADWQQVEARKRRGQNQVLQVLHGLHRELERPPLRSEFSREKVF